MDEDEYYEEQEYEEDDDEGETEDVDLLKKFTGWSIR
jgi:hypothetical protein